MASKKQQKKPTKKSQKKPVKKPIPEGPRFLYGPLQAPNSSWVDSYGLVYVRKGKNGMGVAVQFKDGFSCWYPGTDSTDYQKFRKARSKGKWVWKYLYDLEYEAL